MRKLAKLISLLSVFMFWHPVHAAKGPEERLVKLYGELLDEHTYEGSDDGLQARLVDYPALAEDDRWASLIDLLARYPEASLDSPDERKAFYLNAYNILALNKVMEHWPIRSLRSVGSAFVPVWKHEAGVVSGATVTLSYLEHDVLRVMGDPRVHMAINCASLSCPDLRGEPYRAKIIDAQLDEQARRFLQQQGKGILLDDERQAVRLSSIFDWFEEDFEAMGGVERFVRTYSQALPEGWAMAADLPYNWKVNGKLSAHALRAMRDDF